MSFVPNRTRFLDHLQNGSLLFRGNVPESGGVFVLKDVLDSMEQQAKISGVSFERSAPFYDFTLLSEIFDHDAYNKEDAFFEQHPNIGKLLHDDVDGIAARAIIHGKHALGKAMLDIVKQVHTALEMNGKINVYLHCNAGLDRTGIISAGYGLLYQNYTPEQAKGQNIALGLPRGPNSTSMFAIDAMIGVLATP